MRYERGANVLYSVPESIRVFDYSDVPDSPIHPQDSCRRSVFATVDIYWHIYRLGTAIPIFRDVPDEDDVYSAS